MAAKTPRQSQLVVKRCMSVFPGGLVVTAPARDTSRSQKHRRSTTQQARAATPLQPNAAGSQWLDLATKGLADLVPYCELKCSHPQAKTKLRRVIELKFPTD